MHESVKHLLLTFPKHIAQLGGGEPDASRSPSSVSLSSAAVPPSVAAVAVSLLSEEAPDADAAVALELLLLLEVVAPLLSAFAATAGVEVSVGVDEDFVEVDFVSVFVLDADDALLLLLLLLLSIFRNSRMRSLETLCCALDSSAPFEWLELAAAPDE